jgi:hypothetical protein
MKINQLTTTKNYLYEGLDSQSLRSIKLWESAGRKLVEYEMTADQISQLFAQVQKGATDAGSNRTMIGKGKDAAAEVGKAWEDLKTKVANSGPIQNVDAQYDKAAEKLKQATGGDAGVMKYVQKYRDFAKAHPVAQSLIYAALIAAAGISGVGAGGAAALGLFKMTDKLLQGEKFSSAAYAGAKTGALAYGAGQVGKALQGGDQATALRGGDADAQPGGFYGQATPAGEPPAAGNTPGGQVTPGSNARTDLLAQKVASATADRNLVADIAGKMGMSGAKHTANFVGGVPVSIDGVPVPANLFTPDQLTRINAAKSLSNAMNEAQIKRIFYTAARIQQLNEGIWDKVKGAVANTAGAVATGAAKSAVDKTKALGTNIANKAQTVGTNLTTKVTADKLMTAWKKAGSPTDSDAVAAIMKQAGVDDAIVASSMKAASGQTTPAGAAAPAPVDAQTQKFIQQLVASYQALTPAEKATLKKELEDAVTASDVGGNVVKGTMESRRSKKRTV